MNLKITVHLVQYFLMTHICIAGRLLDSLSHFSRIVFHIPPFTSTYYCIWYSGKPNSVKLSLNSIKNSTNLLIQVLEDVKIYFFHICWFFLLHIFEQGIRSEVADYLIEGLH